jgi:nitrite reductase/ring-hydroxylating ferredoxin subunit
MRGVAVALRRLYPCRQQPWSEPMAWIDVLSLADLEAKGKVVVRTNGRQILVIRAGERIFACANRCPHEGYPLLDGTLANGCVLTCNWHNWKFDLDSGETLVGGDRLDMFRARISCERVLVEITEPDPAERRKAVLKGLTKALGDKDQQRLVRETARLTRLGEDPLDAVRKAVNWVAERLEFGTTHALAGAADWLRLYDDPDTAEDERLAALGEILGHVADDGHGGKDYPFPKGKAAWGAPAFLAAIEAEDEAAASALVSGALRAGWTFEAFLPTLLEAALAHYNDFGHSLIYTVKTAALAQRLGPETTPVLLRLLVRSLVSATHEDLVPEFASYPVRRAAWGKPILPQPHFAAASILTAGSAKKAMADVAAWGLRHTPERIFEILVEAAAWQLLHADETFMTRADGKLADNVGWLDFTHALTFAEAGRSAARVDPGLWPAILLQLACFIGRNSAYTDENLDVRPFLVEDIGAFLAQSKRGLFDHGRDRFIVSVHLLKTLMAGAVLVETVPQAAPLVAAGLDRLLRAKMKGRHVLRTARQMLDLVARE